MDNNKNTIIPPVPQSAPPTPPAPLLPTSPVIPGGALPPLPEIGGAIPTMQPPAGIVTPPTTTTTTTTTTTPATPLSTSEPIKEDAPAEPLVEPEFPKKSKKKILPAIMAVVALFLVVGLAGAAYYVSSQLSTRQAVAPNAPESEPMAAGCTYTSCGAANCGQGYYCVQNATTACWSCAQSGGTCKPGQEFFCGGCINGCKPATKTCNTWIAEECGGGSSSSSSGGGGCPSIPNLGSTGPAGSSCDANNCGGGSCNKGGINYTFKCGTLCYKDSCGASACGSGGGPYCPSDKRDAPYSKSITFSKAGTINVFTRNSFTGNIYFSGPKNVTIALTSGNASKNPATFKVIAGQTYNMKVQLSGEPKEAYGWIKNKAATVCGPVKSSLCGGDTDITALVNAAAAGSDVSGITAGGQPANTQCWGDAERGIEGEDYDYNDLSIILGYTVRPAYCSSSTVEKTGVAPASKVAISPGESVTMKSVSNKNLNGFYYYVYNMENLYGPGNPKPVCVGNDPVEASCAELDEYGNPDCACPTGGHHLYFADPNNRKDGTNLRTTGSVAVPYADLFVFDKRGNMNLKKAQINNYFSLNGADWSAADGKCVTWVDAGASPIPNCSNVTGPNKLTLGETGTYTAKYYAAPSGGLTDGSIFMSNTVNGVDQKDIIEINAKCDGKYNCPVTNGSSLTAAFKPTAVGKYYIRCRAWNDGIAECRPPATVDGPPRFACAGGQGGSYEMLVEVVQQAPQCIASKMFEKKDNQWVIATDPSKLKSGTEVRFGVIGNLSTMTKARFKINGGAWTESTTTMTASDGKVYVYIAHTLVSGDYSVQSEIQ